MDYESQCFVDCNPAAASIFGFDSVSETIGKTPFDVSAPVQYDNMPSQEKAHYYIEKAVLEGNIVHEWRAQRQNGEIWDAEVHLMSFKLDDRQLIQFTLQDITKRKQAEQNLLASEQYYRKIFGETSDAIFIHDLSGKILDVNKTVNRMFGVTRDEALNCTIEDLSQGEPPYIEETAAKYFARAVEEGPQLFEWLARKKNDTLFWAEVHLEHSVINNKGAIIAVVRDITHRKEAEQALADSERRLLDIIEFLPDATFVIDINSRLIAWNKAVEKMTGVKKEDVLNKVDYAYAIPFYGKPRPILIDLVLKRDPQWEQKYTNIREEDGILVESEAFLPLLGENGRHIAATASRLYDAEGNVVGAIESIRDVTEIKNVEKEREQLISELQEALSKVRTLSGLLPICASCKKIRDDKGYWNQIESYIHKHSDAEFSHGICPECLDKLYGGQDWYKKGKKKNKF